MKNTNPNLDIENQHAHNDQNCWNSPFHSQDKTKAQIVHLQRKMGKILILLGALTQRISPQYEEGYASGFSLNCHTRWIDIHH